LDKGNIFRFATWPIAHRTALTSCYVGTGCDIKKRTVQAARPVQCIRPENVCLASRTINDN
jgi:hypothetical protein